MKTVITYGVFDLYHVGHENLLRRAKALGDRLIVGVCSDEFAIKRGKINLVDSLNTRMENIRNSGFADEIIVEEFYGQKILDVLKYGADIFVIGDDWAGQFDYLKEYCQVVYLPRTPGISSTKLRNMDPIRIGIVGSGRIACRFVDEVQFVKKYLQIQGIFNPNLEHGRVFAQKYELTACESYAQLLENCDAIYVASPPQTHYAYCKEALLLGKHVLCEKPMVLRQQEAEDLYAIAEDRHAVLMEAIKTAYCPGFLRVVAAAKSGAIGEIVDVDACFTRLTDRSKREWTDSAFGGSFLEFGSYILLPVIKFLGQEGVRYTFFSALAENGVDRYTRFVASKGQTFASGKCGIGAKSEGQLIISGTQGYILVDAPWWKTSHYEIRHEDPRQREEFDVDFLTEGLRYELYDFINQIYGNRISAFKLTRDESVALATIFEQFLRERGR